MPVTGHKSMANRDARDEPGMCYNQAVDQFKDSLNLWEEKA